MKPFDKLAYELRQFTSQYLEAIQNREAAVSDKEAAVEVKIQESKEVTDKAQKELQEAQEQATMNNKRSDLLNERESKVKELENLNESMAKKYAAKTQEVDERKAEVLATNTKAQELLKQATADRTSAKLLLDQAKEQIEEAEAKEKLVNVRSNLLDGKEADLNKREIALRDRTSIAASH